MAKPTTSSATKVRRIKATDDAPQVKTPKAPTRRAARTTKTKAATAKSKSQQATAQVGYFRGAWQELKLVRWPTRANTWSMTAAVLLFSLIFVIIIILLDTGFNWLFQQVLK